MSEHRGTVAVAVTCPSCDRPGAVAMVTVDDSAGSPGVLHLESLSCPRGCVVDPSDAEAVHRTGLVE